MSTATPTRPPQVTLSGWLTVGGSVVVVVMAFAEVASLGSLETQETIQRYLAEPPGSSFGLSLSDVQTALKITSTVAAVCAAASAVLGWFAMQRSRGARAALSVLAVPLLLAGLTSGGFMTAVVAAAVTMLWLQPARAWFAGLDAPAPVTRRPVARQPVARQPVATAPVAGPTSAPGELPPPTGPPLYPVHGPLPTSVGGPAVLPAARRPMAVVWACVLTWGFSAIIATALVITAIVMAADPDGLLDQARSQNPDLVAQGVTDATLRSAIYAMTGIVVVWAVTAAVFAVLAWRRVRWARVGLLASALVAGGLCLLLALASLLMLVVVAACAATITLLLRSEVRHWYAAPR